MRPLNLREFAEQLRLEGNEFADEILVLSSLEDDVAFPYSEICEDLEGHAPDELKGKPQRIVVWLGERSEELDEIYTLFPLVEDVVQAIRDLIERAPPPMEYDL